MLPTLEDFINSQDLSSYVLFPGFTGNGYLYISKMPVKLPHKSISKIISIINIKADSPGNGSFDNLYNYLINKHYSVFVENVQTERFAHKLRRMGFIQFGRSYILDKDNAA